MPRARRDSRRSKRRWRASRRRCEEPPGSRYSLDLILSFPERPIHSAARPQRPPDDERLRDETRGVIPPAQRHAANRNMRKGVVEIRRPDAQRIERSADNTSELQY